MLKLTTVPYRSHSMNQPYNVILCFRDFAVAVVEKVLYPALDGRM